MPIMFLRVYKSDLHNFHFNPNKSKSLLKSYEYSKNSTHICRLTDCLKSEPYSFEQVKYIINERVFTREILPKYGHTKYHYSSLIDMGNSSYNLANIDRTNHDPNPGNIFGVTHTSSVSKNITTQVTFKEGLVSKSPTNSQLIIPGIGYDERNTLMREYPNNIVSTKNY